MFPKKLFFAAFFLFAFLFFAETQIFACSCYRTQPLLDEFESSDLVVATELVTVEKIREKDKEDEYDIDYIKSVSMRVEKVYKGNVKVGDILTFAQGGGADCIWTFDEDDIGDEYLFYLGKPLKGHPIFDEEDNIKGKDAKPMYYAVTCGRSRGLKGAIDDLLYLDNLAERRGRTRLSGTLGSWLSDAPSFANFKIKITGKNKTYETKADANGVYEVYDLPAGEYLIEPQFPAGWKLSGYASSDHAGYSPYEDLPVIPQELKNKIPITIKEKRHAELNLGFTIDNAGRGKILLPAGKPMKDVCVTAVSTERKEGDYRGQFDCTDENGEFNLESLAAGNYILVVNGDGKIDADEPFGVLFYPGVAERKSAGVVAVEAGKFVRGINIQIPETVELIEIKGQLLFSDGKPVVDERVEFKASDESVYDEDSVKTDSSGRFSINLPKAAKGMLFAEDYVYESQFDECANKAEILKRVGKKHKEVKTNEIEIDGEKSLTGIKLIFPFPGCAKAKEQ